MTDTLEKLYEAGEKILEAYNHCGHFDVDETDLRGPQLNIHLDIYSMADCGFQPKCVQLWLDYDNEEMVKAYKEKTGEEWDFEDADSTDWREEWTSGLEKPTLWGNIIVEPDGKVLAAWSSDLFYAFCGDWSFYEGESIDEATSKLIEGKSK
jgi:hypothetical protein